jgi:hypothetical protein
MRHKWAIIQGSNLADAKKCIKCGCVRTRFYGMIGYETSGGHFLDRAPDCIDWEIENAKTID